MNKFSLGGLHCAASFSTDPVLPVHVRFLHLNVPPLRFVNHSSSLVLDVFHLPCQLHSWNSFPRVYNVREHQSLSHQSCVLQGLENKGATSDLAARFDGERRGGLQKRAEVRMLS